MYLLKVLIVATPPLPPMGAAPPAPPPPPSSPGSFTKAGDATGAAKPETGLGETRATIVDWIATTKPRVGLCPGELGLILLFFLMLTVALVYAHVDGENGSSFLYNFSIVIAALATSGAAFETWRNLRQIERTDEGGMTPHLWLMGVKQHRTVIGSQTTQNVTGLRELYLHNFGPGLAVDARIIVDDKQVDRIPFIAPDSAVQIGGALHGHGMEGAHKFEVLYEASSGREHRLAGTLLRDRDMDELLFRSERLNHIYSIA